MAVGLSSPAGNMEDTLVFADLSIRGRDVLTPCFDDGAIVDGDLMSLEEKTQKLLNIRFAAFLVCDSKDCVALTNALFSGVHLTGIFAVF